MTITLLHSLCLKNIPTDGIDSYDVCSLPAQTLSVNVSALLRTECGVLVDVARSDPALLSLAD